MWKDTHLSERGHLSAHGFFHLWKAITFIFTSRISLCILRAPLGGEPSSLFSPLVGIGRHFPDASVQAEKACLDEARHPAKDAAALVKDLISRARARHRWLFPPPFQRCVHYPKTFPSMLPFSKTQNPHTVGLKGEADDL